MIERNIVNLRIGNYQIRSNIGKNVGKNPQVMLSLARITDPRQQTSKDLFLISGMTNFIRYLKVEKMGNFGATEIILILLVVILLFGARKIPELMKGIGQGMKEFKKASKVEDDDNKFSAEEKKKSEE